MRRNSGFTSTPTSKIVQPKQNLTFKKQVWGFTLIELLIVIAILGILAGLILTAVGKSRERSEDIRVKSGIRQLRVLAESYFTSNASSYTGFNTCVESPSVANCKDQVTNDNVTTLVADIEDANLQSNSVDAAALGNDFCIAAPLRETSTYACTDASGELYENTSASPPCAGAQAVCTFS